MKRITAIMLAAGLLFGTAAQAEEIDGKKPLVCGIFEVHECIADDGCERVQPSDINLKTRFLDVDPRKGEIRARGTERVTQVDEVIPIGDKLVFAGAESGNSAQQSGVGFSLAVTKTDGTMTMSLTGDGVSFVIFGACTAE